jgi:hypothetical protein
LIPHFVCNGHDVSSHPFPELFDEKPFAPDPFCLSVNCSVDDYCFSRLIFSPPRIRRSRGAKFFNVNKKKFVSHLCIEAAMAKRAIKSAEPKESRNKQSR